jgi:hypothetical protein
MTDQEGLVALETHMMFVTGVKEAVRKARGKVPDPSMVSPTILGAEPLEFAMPPMMEQAFGYRGDLRYVEFSYSPKTLKFGYSDGGDHLPSDPNLWTWFLHHPLVSSEIDEGRYPTLFGRFGPEHYPSSDEFFAVLTEGDDKQKQSQACHCLLLDRHQRQPYLCRVDQLVLFFALAEPEQEDQHTVFVDGLLVSPGSENYKAPVSPTLVEQLRVWLDDQFEFVEGRANWPIGGSRHSRN